MSSSAGPPLGASFESSEGRRMLRAAIPRADHEMWDDLVDAVAGNREALRLARSTAALDVAEVADALDQLLGELHFVARATRNSLGDVPDRVLALEEARLTRRVRRWWRERPTWLGGGWGTRHHPPLGAGLRLAYNPSPLQSPGES